MDGGPTVTVVIPTRNRAHLLRNALRSVVEQTLTDIEIVVSDNASTDDTAAVVESFDDPRIVHSPLERNIGLHGNLNRCLGLGTAPYIAFCHDDDSYYPRNLEAKAAFLDDHPSVGAVYAPVDVTDASGTVIASDTSYGGRPPEGVETGSAYLRRMTTQMGLNDFTATVVRRSAVEGHRFAPEDRTSCDLGFWMRLAMRADFGFIDEVLSTRMLHEASQSAVNGVEVIEPDGGSHVTVDYVVTMLATKRRFFREHGAAIEDVASMRQLSERAARSKLAATVARDNPDRRLGPTLRSAAVAARAKPSVLNERAVLSAVVKAGLGHRGRELARSVRARVG